MAAEILAELPLELILEESSLHGQHNKGAETLEYVPDGFSQKIPCSTCGTSISGDEPCFYAAGAGTGDAFHIRCAEFPERIGRRHASHLHGQSLALRSWRHLSADSDCCCICGEAIMSNSQATNRTPYYYFDDCPSGSPRSMHVSCALTPLLKFDDDDGDGDGDQPKYYACHGLRMGLLPSPAAARAKVCVSGRILDLSLRRKLCFSCGSPWCNGPGYTCAGARHCNNFFHKSCAELPRTIKHLGHDSSHNLNISIDPPSSCGVCGRGGRRHVYRCSQDRFVLGTECAFRGTSVMPSTGHHHHGLVFVEDRPNEFRCNACKKSYEEHRGIVAAEVDRTRSLTLRCAECVFNLHFLCCPLPSVVEFDYHTHPLVLVDLLIEDDSGEYYCDVCEEERDLRFRAYHCARCKYTAHIHCLLPEILKLIKQESTTNVEFWALGESRWNASIEMEHGKEVAREEKKTMFDIIMELTVKEYEKLGNCYLEYSSAQKRYRDKTKYNQGRRLMTFLDTKTEYENEDVDMIEEFFRIKSGYFSELCDEVSHFTPMDWWTLVDTYLPAKVVDFGGYVVPPSLAPVLKMLLDKYGDLGGDSSLTPQMKSTTATLLCAVINKMHNTMVEDMNVDDLKYWYYVLNSVKKIAGYKIIDLASFEEFVVTAFLGFEATRLMKEASESLDHKIAKLEAELKKCRGKRERLEQCPSIASDFMKECLRRASDSKWKTVDVKLF